VMLEYYFPNEAAEPLLWHPVLFAYTLLVSGADLLILAALAYLSGSLRKAIPLMTMLGIGFFAVVLAGPLADLRSPQRAALIFTRPHIVATASNPGISLTAFQSIAWLVALVLSVIFALLTFSYYSHQASLTSSGFRRTIYQAFSLGVTTSERYGSVEKAAKVVAVLMLPFLTLWGIYPASLFIMQTWNPAWRSWALLPVTYFADTFVVATALFMLVYFIWRYGGLERDVVVPILKIHAAGSLSVAALTGLQMAIWWSWSPGTAEMVSPLIPLMYLVIALLLLSFFLSLVAMRYPATIPVVALVAMAGTFTNKWNIIVNAQLISKTGLAFLEAELGGLWVLETAAPIALGIAVFILLSMIFPLEVREGGK
jgi:predicted membrane protein